MGLPFGLPHDVANQRDLLRDVLQAAAAIDRPRGYVELPHQCPERRVVAIREPATPPPIVRLLANKPWLLPHLVSGNLPGPRVAKSTAP